MKQNKSEVWIATNGRLDDVTYAQRGDGQWFKRVTEFSRSGNSSLPWTACDKPDLEKLKRSHQVIRLPKANEPLTIRERSRRGYVVEAQGYIGWTEYQVLRGPRVLSRHDTMGQAEKAKSQLELENANG